VSHSGGFYEQERGDSRKGERRDEEKIRINMRKKPINPKN
jgi:hypothetical protein